MPRLAILGLDTFQHDWLAAIAALRATGEIDLVAIGHHSAAAARDVAEIFKPQGPIPAFDDPRRLLQDAAPQVLLMDRPANVALDFLITCAAQGIAILSLGPPVESLAEAQALAAALEPRTHLLYIWPRFADSPAARRCAQADDYLRPIRFASASWLGINHALAAKSNQHPKPAPSPIENQKSKIENSPDLPVRSLSVLAWDLLDTLITLMGLPTSVYAAIRGTAGSGNNFADISGAAAVTLRFPDDAAASLTICDRAPTGGETAHRSPFNRRDLLLWGGGGGGGTLRLSHDTYEFRDDTGKLIDSSPPILTPPIENQKSKIENPQATLREFLRHFDLPPSPHRGWPHHLEEIAATLEALIVSHRTGQPESPDRLRRLRR